MSVVLAGVGVAEMMAKVRRRRTCSGKAGSTGMGLGANLAGIIPAMPELPDIAVYIERYCTAKVQGQVLKQVKVMNPFRLRIGGAAPSRLGRGQAGGGRVERLQGKRIAAGPSSPTARCCVNAT